MGNLARHHILKRLHSRIPTIIPISISILPCTCVHLVHNNPMRAFAFPISRPCPAFVRKASLKVKSLFQASELSFSLSLWKPSRKLVNVSAWHKVQVISLPAKDQ